MTPVICTVDTVLLALRDEELVVALLKRERKPYKGAAALPGGYIHADEDMDARDAAHRVLLDKTGIDEPFLEQLATFSGPARDPRGGSVAIAYYALIRHEILATTAHPDLVLVSVDRVHTLPFDHKNIVETAVERLRIKSPYSPLPCFLAGELFTLPQLQRIYEALNKVSFRRKMNELDVLEPAGGQMESAGAHRSAQLYRFKPPFRSQPGLLKRGL